MPDAQPAFVALLPDRALHDRIQAAKDAVQAAVGSQRYLDDPPHLTLYLACFAAHGMLLDLIPDLATTLPAPRIDIDGWHIFSDDPLTGGHTPVTAIDDGSRPALRALQGRVVRALAPQRDVAASRARYDATWNRLTPRRQASVEAHGFPFTGDDWQPHVTVCSVASESWPDCEPVLAAHEPHGSYGFAALAAFALDEDRPRLLTRAELAAG